MLKAWILTSRAILNEWIMKHSSCWQIKINCKVLCGMINLKFSINRDKVEITIHIKCKIRCRYRRITSMVELCHICMIEIYTHNQWDLNFIGRIMKSNKSWKPRENMAQYGKSPTAYKEIWKRTNIGTQSLKRCFVRKKCIPSKQTNSNKNDKFSLICWKVIKYKRQEMHLKNKHNQQMARKLSKLKVSTPWNQAFSMKFLIIK